MTIPIITPEKRAAILEVADKYGIYNIRVFGSVATGDADEDSDLDLLIDMKRPSLFKLGGFQYLVEEIMNCHVDVVELEAIKYPVIREAILSQERPL